METMYKLRLNRKDIYLVHKCLLFRFVKIGEAGRDRPRLKMLLERIVNIKNQSDYDERMNNQEV
jgi:hypothetical protein